MDTCDTALYYKYKQFKSNQSNNNNNNNDDDDDDDDDDYTFPFEGHAVVKVHSASLVFAGRLAVSYGVWQWLCQRRFQITKRSG